MTTKEQYERVITDVGFTLSNLQVLETSLTEAGIIMDDKVTLIENTLLEIDAAAQTKLDELAQEQVMTNFLAEMKLVFDKYSTKLEIGSNDGYGESYGGGDAEIGFKFTVAFDEVVATKYIGKAVILSGDLV